MASPLSFLTTQGRELNQGSNMYQFSEHSIDAAKSSMQVAVVIPCFRCKDTISDVIRAVPDFVTVIICVEDCSKDGTREHLYNLAEKEPRLVVVTHDVNQGVGGATVSGYRRALDLNADIIVKMDSDGQMDPEMVSALIEPIVEGEADYTKGNRFFDLQEVQAMPTLRLIGNAALSFFTKLSTGYWDLFDPTNGFTALHANVAKVLPLDRLHQRYFFESDILFRLSTVRAKIVEVPMVPIYNDEHSNLSVVHTLLTFPGLHIGNFLKRIVYSYFLRGFSAGSISLLVGLALAGFGTSFGAYAWFKSYLTGMAATSGTVMVSALPLILGVQFLLHFLNHDISSVPQAPIHKKIKRFKALKPSWMKVD
jgi:glycosyltransferase involved in cell wall biosynthesis